MRLLSAANPAWPILQIRKEPGSRAPFAARLEDGRAEIPLLGDGCLSLERDPLTATFLMPRPLRDEELIHPYLAPAAALASHWLGREPFHAGAVAGTNGAWGIVGARERGKSTVLAALALAGRAVLADDLLVVGGDGFAFSGPRSIDLRGEAAQHLGAGAPLGVIGERERWRLGLAPAPEPIPFCGWIFLDWGYRDELQTVDATQRLGLLLPQRAVAGLPPADQTRLLELLARPAWLLRRRRGWESMQASLDLIESVID